MNQVLQTKTQEHLDAVADTEDALELKNSRIEIYSQSIIDLNNAINKFGEAEKSGQSNVLPGIAKDIENIGIKIQKSNPALKEFMTTLSSDFATTAKQSSQVAARATEDYEKIIKTETQPLFWGIWPEIEVTDNSVFDLYFDPNNGKYDHDRNENHVFKNLFNDKEIFINGVTLFSKEKMISHREFIHRFLIEKKEHNRTVSKHKPYDVVFISYNESNADSNYKKLLDKCPRANRVHGVKGIHQAHIKAAKLCNTDMFWVVDGDAIIEDGFNFNLVMSSYDIDCVHVWKSRNPVNDLEYGNGGIKLLPRQMVVDMNVDTSDMTTSISKKFKAVDKVSNINSFNTDEFSTWRSAFRECCKLASRVIERQDEEETTLRLQTWCSKGEDKPFGKYAMLGAKSGKLYGELNKNNSTALAMINNFDWLKEQFDARQD
jgi:hypothetical protein